MRSLDTFWKKTECSIKWKINVFNAVILTKLSTASVFWPFERGAINSIFRLYGGAACDT